jgi:mannosyltransferase OCH1-like enzyme
MTGAVSEAKQNLIMKHANICTFLNHYLPRHIDADMQNIMNGRDSNTTLMRAITQISQWIDKRRPQKLTNKQRASIHKHPKYLTAVSQQDQQEIAYQENPSSQMLSKLQ